MRKRELEEYIVTISRQSKAAEAKPAELQNAGNFPFVSPIIATTSCPITTPCHTRTLIQVPPSSTATTKPLDSIPCPSRVCEDICDPRNTVASTTPIATF